MATANETRVLTSEGVRNRDTKPHVLFGLLWRRVLHVGCAIEVKIAAIVPALDQGMQPDLPEVGQSSKDRARSFRHGDQRSDRRTTKVTLN